MNDADDFVASALASLTSLDPALDDAPPPRGSSRHASILERAMSESESETPRHEEASGPLREHSYDAISIDRHGTGAPRRWRRTLPIVVGIIAAALLAAVLLVVKPFGTTRTASAAERIGTAADKTADANTFRVFGDYAEVGSRLQGEVAGADSRSVFTNVDARTGATSSMSVTVVGDREWQTVNGKTTEQPARGPEGRNAPFQQASHSVISAALHGAGVTEIGSEQVRGVDTTHYRITLTRSSRAALSALAENELSAFELEYPQNVATIDLWIADDLIRRIHVAGIPYGAPGSQIPPNDSDGTRPVPLDSTVEFYDFGAPITIRPPR